MEQGLMRTINKNGSMGRKVFPYLMVSPYFIVYIIFGLFPILYTFYLSFFKWDGISSKIFIGLSNYKTLISDVLFYKTLVNSAILALLTLPFQLIMGFLIARVLTSKNTPMKNAFRLMNFLPYITNSIAVGLLFSVLFTWNGGPVNNILMFLGLIKENIFWTGNAWPARIMVAIMLIWQNSGYTALFFMAGITNINPVLFEAAEIDGVNSIQRDLYITIPLLKNISRFVVLTGIIGLLQLFDSIFCLFSGVASNAPVITGGPDNAVLTTVWYLYQNGFGSVTRMGYASAIAYGLFAAILVITMVINRIFYEGEQL